LIIGLISDTHDNLKAIEKAVKVFNYKGVGIVLHAGDFISPFTARAFKDLKGQLIGVYGNNDGEKEGLKEAYSKIGAEIKGNFTELVLDGKRIALYHATIQSFLNALVRSRSYDVVIHGHTHNRNIEKIGNTVVVNPGEACGYLTGKGSIAILDLKTRKVEIETIIKYAQYRV
jgi:putative phosphoesterase